ncbi:hypothetical protein PR202_gb12115 [Eleusine coracana subsp. coracana]|uniref:Uncharacterized protein n=1 Tax=Eleusine coracana subsp. coracana TaxID=191504 RepID=A0AAV5ENF5_ELECO|nr:hypothetical protein PR202_gb12115 [Eleusine coracana subsp. coracana]
MYKKILKYDLGKHSLSVMIDMPDDFSNNVPILMEDGSLGLAGIRGSSLRLWSRKVNQEGAEQWVQRRSINLQSTVPGIDKQGGGARSHTSKDLLISNVLLHIKTWQSGRVHHL